MDLKNELAKRLKERLNVSPDLTLALFDAGIVSECGAKRFLIRDEYADKAKENKKTELKERLADKYCVSFSTVDKYISF